MAKVLSELTKDALALPSDQRLTLARILIDLSEDDHDFSPQNDELWEREIARRLTSVRAGQAQSRSFEGVFADLDSRFFA